MVLCHLYLTRFHLTKGLIIDTFFIVFFANCVVVISEYLNSNQIQYQLIGKLKKTLKSNNPGQTKLFCLKMLSRQDFFGKKCAAGKTYEGKCATGNFFGLNHDGYFVLLKVFKSLFTNHRLKCSFFIHEFINS